MRSCPHEDRSLAELVNPLVITETGLLKPIAYDFDGHFDGRALAGLEGRHGFIDWFDHCTRLSEARGR